MTIAPRAHLLGLNVSSLFRCLVLLSAAVSASDAMSAAPTATPAATPAAKLDRTTLSAKGSQSAVLNVNAFGRYAITATSNQGVALQLVDHMTGAGQRSGAAGIKDGRLDLFLDRGEFKILTHADEQGKGQLTLAAHAYQERNKAAPLLLEYRTERSTLGDFEQRSYWLEISETRTVALEAAGRHLVDLRLWRDGLWLVDATPRLLQSQARPSQPLQIAQLTTELTPGRYLLTAYGGESQVWTESSDAKPFLLRYGIPALPAELRQHFTMSEFGTDRYRVPGRTNYFRLELPEAHAATLHAGSFSAEQPFRVAGLSASIGKNSLPPVADVNADYDAEQMLITVSMEAGKPFVLQHFEKNRSLRYRHSQLAADVWLSTVHAGPLEDSVGASAVLTRTYRHSKEHYLDDRVIPLQQGQAWRRRFNLLGELTLFVKLDAPLKLRASGSLPDARYRFEPFLLSRPYDYKTPPWRNNNAVFELDRGLHVLTVSPETKGILDLQLSSPDAGATATLAAALPSARFFPLRVETDVDYSLYLNQQPGVANGVVMRQLPIDPVEPLPISLAAGEALTIPILISEPGTLRAVSETGQTLPLTMDNGSSGERPELTSGNYRVSLRGGTQAQQLSLQFEPKRLASTTPLPAIPDGFLAGLPKYPEITADAPRHLEMDRRSATVQNVRVDRAGFYQFETSGLLRTRGVVRTRVNPSLFEAAENGVGRNFQIQQYLREGDYQLVVETQGDTKGPLGVQLARTPLIDGGELRENVVARALLPPTQAIAYRFRIAERGNYRLQTLGLGRTFPIRLEDDAGWPVAAPVLDGNQTLELAEGSYRVIVLPQTAAARVLTRLERIGEAIGHTGHGPHPLVLDSQVAHEWIEPEQGETRTPDQWTFDLPAAGEVMLSVDNEMQGSLLKVNGNAVSELARLTADRAWRGQLPRGSYQLQLRNSRDNNHVRYQLSLSTVPLMAGLSRRLTIPATVPIAVGEDGIVELQSFGSDDVRARLLDAAGNLIAQSDDRSDDWNFHFAQRLRPGSYRLQIDPLSERNATTTVTMFMPKEVVEAPLALGKTIEINDGQVHIFPLHVPAERNTLLVSAQSGDTVGLALEGQSGENWISLGAVLRQQPFLALPLATGTGAFSGYRLRAWSVDRRSLQVKLRAVAAALPVASEAQLAQGITPHVVDEAVPAIGMAIVSLARPGTFRFEGDVSPLQWSYDTAQTARAGRNAVVSIAGDKLWLLSEERSNRPRQVVAERLRLSGKSGDSLRLELPDQIRASLDLQPGLSLLIAAARFGQPGIALGADTGPATMGVALGESVTAVLPERSGAARLWNASGSDQPFELDVRQVLLQQRNGAALKAGISDGQLAAQTATPFAVPSGMRRLRLTLAPRNAAVLVKRGTIFTTLWSGNDTLFETVVAEADQLWLINADVQSSQYGIEASVEPGASETGLKLDELFERNVNAAGRLRIPVTLPAADRSGHSEPYQLHVRGKTTALWLAADGRIEAGNDIALHGSGVLYLQHEPGTLVAWLDAPKRVESQGFAAWFKSLSQTDVKPPQVVALRGKQQVLNVALTQTTLLHLRTTTPVVTQFAAPDRSPSTEAHLYGANGSWLAPAGVSRLMVRAAGTEQLSGTASLLTTTATALLDGVGEDVLLAPGGARLYSFEIKQERPIGIGVRASSDVVRSVLYDEHGARRAEGVVQMPTLPAGRYYLVIDIPVDSAPVRLRPIILGLQEPDTRPPAEVLRRFVESKDGAAPLLYMPPAREAPIVDLQDATGTDEAPDEEAWEEGDDEGDDYPVDDDSSAEEQELEPALAVPQGA